MRICVLLLFERLLCETFGLLLTCERAEHVADHPTGGEQECVLAVSLRKCDLTETQRQSEQRAKWLIQTKTPESWIKMWGTLKYFPLPLIFFTLESAGHRIRLPHVYCSLLMKIKTVLWKADTSQSWLEENVPLTFPLVNNKRKMSKK